MTADWSRSRVKKKFALDANEIPIAPIVTHYGGEVREGRACSVRCCLHNDSRRSAVINTIENLYFCHTCGKGGNAVNLIQILEEMDFKDALDKALSISGGSGTPLRGSHKSRGARLPRRTWDI